MTTALARLRGGDWNTPLLAAAAALLAAILAAETMASSSLLLPEEDADLTAAMWLRLVAGFVGTAYWSPVVIEVNDEEDFAIGGSTSLAPLTVTLAGLLALYTVLRRARRTDAGPWEHSLRAAAPFAFGVALLSGVFGRVSLDDGVVIRTAFVEPLVGALALATAVAMLAYRDLWKPLPAGVVAFGERWWNAARVAAYGLGVAIALSSLTSLLLVFLHHKRLDGWGNVFGGLPAFFGVILNCGIALLSVASGGRIASSIGPTEYIALYRLHGLSRWYWLLALIPIVTVVLTARYAARRGGVSWPRVTAVFVGTWVVLAWASRLRFGFAFSEVGGSATAGASLLWGALALGAWIGLVAPFLAPRVAKDVEATEDPGIPAPRPRRETGPAHVLVATLAVVAMLGAAVGSVVAGVQAAEIDQEQDAP